MPQPIGVLVVASPGCHFCDGALRLLDEVAESSPLQIETLPLSSELRKALLVPTGSPFRWPSWSTASSSATGGSPVEN